MNHLLRPSKIPTRPAIFASLQKLGWILIFALTAFSSQGFAASCQEKVLPRSSYPYMVEGSLTDFYGEVRAADHSVVPKIYLGAQQQKAFPNQDGFIGVHPTDFVVLKKGNQLLYEGPFENIKGDGGDYFDLRPPGFSHLEINKWLSEGNVKITIYSRTLKKPIANLP